MSIFSFFSKILRGPHGLSPADFLQQRDATHTVLDVRTAGEFAEEHLKDALNVDVQAGDFAERVERLVRKGTLTTGHPVYLYCRSGARSARATQILRKQGFSEAYNVGGIGGLKAAGAKMGR